MGHQHSAGEKLACVAVGTPWGEREQKPLIVSTQMTVEHAAGEFYLYPYDFEY